eukprot:3552232-Pleurochrysis_carterae.AAC.1
MHDDFCGLQCLQELMDAMAKELASVRAEFLNQDKCTMDAKNSLDKATEEAERLTAELKKSSLETKQLHAEVAKATKQVKAAAKAAALARASHEKEKEDTQKELGRMERLLKELMEKSADLKMSQ